ncbi:hypothetical protein Patl1_19206 [Pistacia atlantica]|uniref:Uncharacterized protein n=1 Tax=Pistacia atlantica TaxID=434234 RepID=A0ACC1C2B6_9ROSI|nr:hypothetical protein Patl1_19206 [Pistacia atlantica]
MSSLAMAAKNLTTDQSALLQFKAHITSDPSRVLAYNWSISNPICQWVGISCDARHGRVTTLNLSSMDLGGTIPPHLGHILQTVGNLSGLILLYLNDNNLAGEIPQEIYNLHGLQSLALGSNSLTAGES